MNRKAPLALSPPINDAERVQQRQQRGRSRVYIADDDLAPTRDVRKRASQSGRIVNIE